VKGIRLNPNSRLKVLTDDQVDMIHEASLRILERTGIRYDSEDARKRQSDVRFQLRHHSTSKLSVLLGPFLKALDCYLPTADRRAIDSVREHTQLHQAWS
jgi:hypothetical protein